MREFMADTGLGISKLFKNKFLNTRCPPDTSYKYLFFDDLHPMSHAHRMLARTFDEFIRRTG